jgi:hypothetical protein
MTDKGTASAGQDAREPGKGTALHAIAPAQGRAWNPQGLQQVRRL